MKTKPKNNKILLDKRKGPTYSSGSYFFGGTGKMDHQNLGLVFFLILGDF